MTDEAPPGSKTERGGPPVPVRWRAFKRLRWPQWLSQVRLLVVVLLFLGIVGALMMGPSGPSFALAQLGLFPLVAGGTDALLSRYRWRRWRMPWSAVVTGLLIALVIPPQGGGLLPSSPLLLDGAILSAVAVVGKHVLRFRGSPVLNPASSAVLLGGALLSIGPAWWGTLGPSIPWVGGGGGSEVAFPLFVVGGLLVNLRTWRRWPLPAAFFVTYGIGVTLQRALAFSFIGVPLSGPILLSEVVDPATLFFLLFMVVEPRTAPANPHAWPLYGAFVGAVSAFLAITVPALGAQSTVGPFALLLALKAGNLLTTLLRRGSTAGRVADPARPDVMPTRQRVRARDGFRTGPANRARWGWPEGILAATAVLVLLGAAYSATPPSASLSASSLTSVALSCAHDNLSIPAGERQSLHYLLGPSIIFWYDNASGRTVFYDPVDNVTVYETDLYEDHGVAEWNGDDTILSEGCHPEAGAPRPGALL